MIKTGLISIVRIGYALPFALRMVIKEHDELCVAVIGHELLHVRVMPLIEREDVIEVMEILRRKFTGRQTSHVYAPAPGGRYRAVIRRVADVIAMGSCGVDMKTILQTPGMRLVSKNRLGSRRAADIPGTYK